MSGFRWSALPPELLADLAAALGIAGDPAASIAARFGAEPCPELVRLAWPALRDGWLRRDHTARARIVSALLGAGLGGAGSRQRGDARYLASCRNAPRLRGIVAGELRRAGLDPAVAPGSDTADLDIAVELAWAAFADDVGRRLVVLDEGDTVAWELPSACPVPPSVLAVRDGGRLRAEVSSNSSLPPAARLTAGQVRLLGSLGWQHPTRGADEPPDVGSANFVDDVPIEDGPLLAARLVATMREVFGVVHPAFVDPPARLEPPAWAQRGSEPGCPDPAGGTGPRGRTGEGSPACDAPGARTDPADVAVMPSSPDHLRALLHSWLTDVLGSPPPYDDDGDAVVRQGEAVVYVRVQEELAAVELTAPLMARVPGTPLVLDRVNRLNDELAFPRLVWRGGVVVLVLRVDCLPFVALLATSALDRMTDGAEALMRRLPLEVGDWAGPDPEDGRGAGNT